MNLTMMQTPGYIRHRVDLADCGADVDTHFGSYEFMLELVIDMSVKLNRPVERDGLALVVQDDEQRHSWTFLEDDGE